MTCPGCQHENPGDAVFCQECGTRLEAACPSCGTPNQLGAKFCRKCGQRLSQTETAQAAPGPRFGSPESYTPKHLAERIITSKAALEGERKQVTVLFADLKGSMELLADRDPEEARKLLDPVLERMMEAVHRYEGTVNQVMGDGIMALFGAPIAHEDRQPRREPARGVLLLLVRRYRPEYHHAWARQDPTTARSGSIPCRPRAPTSCSRRSSAPTPLPRPAQAAPGRADGGELQLFLEESVASPGGDGGPGRRARRLPVDAASPLPDDPRYPHRPFSPRASIAWRPSINRLVQAAAVIGKDVTSPRCSWLVAHGAG